tara:strand:- start:1404 stop:1847 length:444 start_codon:yes stop_codon:yes gene_type:complete
MRNPALIFLIFFVGTPLLELYVLIEVGSVLGAFPTILLSIFTAIVGATMVRLQGFSIFFRAQEAIARGAAPTIEILEGTVLLIIGLALLLPGFLTDIIGFLLLVPLFRRKAIFWFLSKNKNFINENHAPDENKKESSFIEGEYHRDE